MDEGGGGQWLLKLVSAVCLLLAFADFFDITHRMEVAARGISEWLWKIYPRYWRLIYHTEREEMTGAPRVLADAAHSIFVTIMVLGILFGGFLFGEPDETLFAIWKLFALGAVIVLLSPLVLSAIVWLLHLLGLPRKGIVGTVSLLLAVGTFALDMMR